MATAPFLLAIWALLLTPGPTNMVMTLAGAQGGWRRATALIPIEIAAYLIVIVPAALAGASVLADWPMIAALIKLAAAAWLLSLALALWKGPGEGDAGGQMGPGRVFVTTLLNPKALIIGLILMPPPASPLFFERLVLFVASTAAAAACWAGLGAGVGRKSDHGHSIWLRRSAASWLALLSGGMALGAMAH